MEQLILGDKMSKKNKADWEIEYERKEKLNNEGIKKLSIEQINIIDKTIKENLDILQHVAECFDIELDQLRKLQDNTWKMIHAFNYQKRNRLS